MPRSQREVAAPEAVGISTKMLAVAACSPWAALAATTPDSLLSLVKSELRPNSYLLKSSSAASKIDEACRELEADGTTPAWPRDLMLLDGRWKLVYSSTLALPLPPIEAVSGPLSGLLEDLPFAPRSVEQRIDVYKRRCINVVSLSPWPSGGPAQLLSALPFIGGALSSLESSLVTLELDHRFSVEGEGGTSGGVRRAAAGSVVDLQLEQVRRRLSKDAKGEDGAAFDDGWNDMLNPQVRKEVRAAEQAAQQGPLFGNPLLDAVPRETAYELPDGLGAFVSGSFETPYAGENVRISRGTFGGPIAELRIFERVGQAKAKVYATWQEEVRASPLVHLPTHAPLSRAHPTSS